jgi:hypothetical protein
MQPQMPTVFTIDELEVGLIAKNHTNPIVTSPIFVIPAPIEPGLDVLWLK